MPYSTLYNTYCVPKNININNNSYIIENFNLSNGINNSNLHIVTSHWNEDLNWLKNIPEYNYSICDKLDNPNYQGTGNCDVPVNKGNEATSYLKYILNHYDNLPDYIMFIHGHDNSYHQKKTIKELLKCAKNRNESFLSLNDTDFSCDDGWKNSLNAFIKYFTKFSNNSNWMSLIDTSANRTVSDCCAQFIVSRNTIYRLPKEAYQALYDDLMSLPNIIILPPDEFPEVSMVYPAMIIERMWSRIFGRPANDLDYKNLYVCNNL